MYENFLFKFINNQHFGDGKKILDVLLMELFDFISLSFKILSLAF